MRAEPMLFVKASDALIVPLYWFFPLKKPSDFGTNRAMPVKEITCPDCDLVLSVKNDEEGLNLNYAVIEWRRTSPISLNDV